MKTTDIRDGKEVQLEIIPIYVRKGERLGTRRVSFKRPSDIYLESEIVRYVLPMGLAFDGNSICIEVTPRTQAVRIEPNTGEEPLVMHHFFTEGDEDRSLTKALNEVQFALKQWLTLLGERAIAKFGGPGIHVYFT